MKNCSNCKHRDKFITEEPCFSCKCTEEWEPKDEDDNVYQVGEGGKVGAE